jgi:hypothetical protein
MERASDRGTRRPTCRNSRQRQCCRLAHRARRRRGADPRRRRRATGPRGGRPAPGRRPAVPARVGGDAAGHGPLPGGRGGAGCPQGAARVRGGAGGSAGPAHLVGGRGHGGPVPAGGIDRAVLADGADEPARHDRGLAVHGHGRAPGVGPGALRLAAQGPVLRRGDRAPEPAAEQPGAGGRRLRPVRSGQRDPVQAGDGAGRGRRLGEAAGLLGRADPPPSRTRRRRACRSGTPSSTTSTRRPGGSTSCSTRPTLVSPWSAEGARRRGTGVAAVPVTATLPRQRSDYGASSSGPGPPRAGGSRPAQTRTSLPSALATYRGTVG